MPIFSKIKRWQNIGQFLLRRIDDYGPLFVIELAQTKNKIVRELIAMVALAVGVLFTLSFLCIAIIITACATPYFLTVVWGVAAFWLVISLAAFFIMRGQAPAEPFKELRTQAESDMNAIQEALNGK
jgi:uncharacterized membrane protein YqjE